MSSYQVLKSRFENMQKQRELLVESIEGLLATVDKQTAGQRGRNPLRAKAKAVRKQIQAFQPSE